jgi:2-methylisocitrate lyase-like PEP mutase family enzyme
VLYANTALQAALFGMQRALTHLNKSGRMGDTTGMLTGFAERQRLVDIKSFQDMERKYK